MTRVDRWVVRGGFMVQRALYSEDRRFGVHTNEDCTHITCCSLMYVQRPPADRAHEVFKSFAGLPATPENMQAALTAMQLAAEAES